MNVLKCDGEKLRLIFETFTDDYNKKPKLKAPYSLEVLLMGTISSCLPRCEFQEAWSYQLRYQGLFKFKKEHQKKLEELNLVIPKESYDLISDTLLDIIAKIEMSEEGEVSWGEFVDLLDQR